MSAWSGLEHELDAWRNAGRTATFWLRDDDACGDSDALQRLLRIADDHAVPLALAVIPAALQPDLAAATASRAGVTVLQHGYAHLNHAAPGARACELGAERAPAAVVQELVAGCARLADAFGGRFLPALVPPWNRIDDGVVAQLPGAGYRGLSTFGARSAAHAAPGLVQCNAHVDPIAWRRDRAFIGADKAIERTVAHLRARREGGVDALEPTGILTHHLAFDAPAWPFLDELLARICAHGAATWLRAHAILAGAAGVTCARSA
ncbi:MAG TPA: polysaccharide deacetylase family protein [Casimicrobiaceae bacterium]|nr:polysaccharide deacetylase family protein [Casimicrobiaceae bacterium]